MNDPTRLKAVLGEFARQQEAWTNRDQEPLAIAAEIKIADWVKITGIGLGDHGQYRITENGVSFKGWTAEQIADAPVWQQPDMLSENEHCLAFPCTPQQLLDFVRGDVSGCLGSLEQPVEALISNKPTLVEERIGTILAACRQLGYDPLNIPYAGKAAIKEICLRTPKLFTEETFRKAYGKASTSNRIRHSGREKYAGRGK